MRLSISRSLLPSSANLGIEARESRPLVPWAPFIPALSPHGQAVFNKENCSIGPGSLSSFVIHWLLEYYKWNV